MEVALWEVKEVKLRLGDGILLVKQGLQGAIVFLVSELKLENAMRCSARMKGLFLMRDEVI